MNRKTLSGLLGIILFIASTFIVINWVSFFSGTAGGDRMDSDYVIIAKWLVSLLCSVIAWGVGSNAWNGDDAKKIKRIFIFSIIADTFLVLGGFLNMAFTGGVGILAFFAVHILLFFRNTSGMKHLLSKENVVSALIILIVSGGFLFFILKPMLKNSPMLFIFGMAYMLILSVSLWSAWSTLKIGHLPKQNAFFTVLGLTLFYLCDIAVIFSITLGTEGIILAPLPVQQIMGYPAWEAVHFMIHNVIWIFYTPALALLALSSYSPRIFKNSRNEEKDEKLMATNAEVTLSET